MDLAFQLIIALFGYLFLVQVFVSSSPQNEVLIQDQGGILSKPSSYVIGANHTTLVVCRANLHVFADAIVGPVAARNLHIKCKGLRHKSRLQYFSTSNDDIQTVTTARLIFTSHDIKQNKLLITCYCTDVSTKEKSPALGIPMKPVRHAISSTSGHFKPDRNRIRTITLRSSFKVSWRFPNSSAVHCFHDGKSLTKDQVVHAEGRISVVSKEAFRRDAGFYYCRSKSGIFSFWVKLQVVGGWSKWRPWLACSTRCGEGKRIETRRCLETRLERCRGPSVRALPCLGLSCEDMFPRFIDEPVNQVIRNGFSTNVTCAVQFGRMRSSVSAVHMVCYNENLNISLFLIQNQTSLEGVRNSTIARIAYILKVEPLRARATNRTDVVHCHCLVSIKKGLEMKSRVAKISFPSVKAPNQVSENSYLSTSHTLYVVGIALAILLAISFVLSVIRRFKRRSAVIRRPSESSLPGILPGIPESWETETVRHFEPPNTKSVTCLSASSGGEDMFENQASNSPLLKYHLEEPSDSDVDLTSQPRAVVGGKIDCDNDSVFLRGESWKTNTTAVTSVSAAITDLPDKNDPAINITTHHSADIGEECLCDSESVFQRGESWKSNKSKVSTFSSVSASFCPKPKLPDTVHPDLCAWGQFTEKGGRLTIEGTGVRLYIPPNALPENASQVIYIGLMNSKGDFPKLGRQEALLSPVVVCGPDGLTFDKPVFLTVPHNAVLDENNCWNTKVQSCEEQGENEWKVLERSGGDAPLSHVSDKYMQIMVDHFTNFAIVGVASSSQEASAQLKSWIVAYFTEPKLDEDDCIIRVYVIPATEASFKVVEVFESKLKGKMSDSPKLLQISNNNKDLQITCKIIREGWVAVAGEQKAIPYDVIWQCTDQSPNVSFIFERDSPQVFKFRSTFDARQEESDKSVEVIVTFCTKAIRRTSSGYESQANGCQVDDQYKIPTELRREICHLLDPEHPLSNDWRILAEKLKIRNALTKDWKDNPKIKSPTNELIEHWEETLSDQEPLSNIEKILSDMGRHDAVQVLQKIPGLKDTREGTLC